MNEQTVLIAAVSCGIGLVLAKKLATKGYAMVLLAHSRGWLGQIAEEIRTLFKVQANANRLLAISASRSPKFMTRRIAMALNR
jgi:short-subunit dehydrogenase